MNDLIYSLLQQNRQTGAVLRRTGVVTDVTDREDGFVVVNLAGDATNSISVPYLFSPGYIPQVNDVVVLLSVGGDHIILGSIPAVGGGYYRRGLTRFRRANSTRTISNNQWEEIAFDTVQDGGNSAEGQSYLSSGRVTIPAAGLWEVVGSVLWPAAANPYNRTIVSVFFAGEGTAGDSNSRNRNEEFTEHVTSHIQNSNGSWPIICSTGDQFAVYLFQSSGASVTIPAGDIWVYAYRIW